MSSLTSLGVNKNSTRFAPKVKARQVRRPPTSSKQESPAASAAAPAAENSVNGTDRNGSSSQADSSSSVPAPAQQQRSAYISSTPIVAPAPALQDKSDTASSPLVEKTPFDIPAVGTPGHTQTPTPFDVSSPTFVDTPSPFMSIATPRRMSSDTEDMRPRQPPPPPQTAPAVAPAASASKGQPIATPITTAISVPQPQPQPQPQRGPSSTSKRPRVARRGGGAPIVAPSRRSEPPAVGSSSTTATENDTQHSDDDYVDEESGGSGSSRRRRRRRRKDGSRKEAQKTPGKRRYVETDPSEWLTLDDIQDDPAPATFLEKPMKYFLQDLQTGIVSKSFKEYEIEQQQKKRMESAAMSEEEQERLAKLKREEEERRRQEAEARRIEEERRKEQESKVLRETSHAPQVRLINGQIVLDTDSLVLERANADQAIDMSTLEVVEENSMSRRVNSRTHGIQSASTRWTVAETDEFYDAIAQFGTDFMMVAHMLPGRTRNQVRLKFNREEKINPDRVKEVLVRKRKPMDIDKLQKMIGKEFEALPENFNEENGDEV